MPTQVAGMKQDIAGRDGKDMRMGVGDTDKACPTQPGVLWRESNVVGIVDDSRLLEGGLGCRRGRMGCGPRHSECLEC